MKIINNTRCNDTYPKRVACENCDSELEYDKGDIEYEEYGIAYLTCPVCGERFILWDEDSLNIEDTDVNFPQYFEHATSDDVMCVSDDDITDMINDCIRRLKYNNSSRIAYIGCGDTYVFVIYSEEDNQFEVIVAKNYYDMIYECTDGGCEDEQA